jgi:thiamine biosynthesis lipoprotein
MGEGALATSGDDERYIDYAGRSYCHILNPCTGWPEHEWQSVSVVAPACLAAGALATIAMLKGAEAQSFLRDQGVAHVLVDAAGLVTRWLPDGPDLRMPG